jgi:transcription-repair coupling factor (superfamily II helicase)
MLRFLESEIDVLVCSMIIESGLDIPNANTIIINRADRFGLAQLYQLRGRVGRSNHRAYAYFLIPPDRTITTSARRRLGAIQEFTDLSSGYKLAMRDLEIRGAGNILGAEQHGHMMAVGFNLYSRLLRDAVRKLKGEREQAEFEPSVELKVDAYIPDSYVRDNDMKISIYKRIRDAQDLEAVDDLTRELGDRFGRVPREVEALLDVQGVRLLCRKVGIKRLGVRRGAIEAEFAEGREPKPSQMTRVLRECEHPLQFDSRRGLTMRFEAPGDRRDALALGRKVLKHFEACGKFT